MDEIVNTIYIISGSFAGVNLEDISAGRCFEIERKLKDFFCYFRKNADTKTVWSVRIPRSVLIV